MIVSVKSWTLYSRGPTRWDTMMLCAHVFFCLTVENMFRSMCVLLSRFGRCHNTCSSSLVGILWSMYQRRWKYLNFKASQFVAFFCSNSLGVCRRLRYSKQSRSETKKRMVIIYNTNARSTPNKLSRILKQDTPLLSRTMNEKQLNFDTKTSMPLFFWNWMLWIFQIWILPVLA